MPCRYHDLLLVDKIPAHLDRPILITRQLRHDFVRSEKEKKAEPHNGEYETNARSASKICLVRKLV
jgi:hypothetical protein